MTRSFVPTQAQDAQLLKVWKKLRKNRQQTNAQDHDTTEGYKAARRLVDKGFDIVYDLASIPSQTVTGVLMKLLAGIDYSNIPEEYRAEPGLPEPRCILSAIEDLRRIVGPEAAAFLGASEPVFDPNYEAPPKPKTPKRPDWDKPINDLWFQRRDVLEAQAAINAEIERMTATGAIVGSDIKRLRDLSRLNEEAIEIVHAIEAKLAAVEPDTAWGMAHQAVLLAHSLHAGERFDKADEIVARRLIRCYDREGMTAYTPKEWLPLIEEEQAERNRREAERDLFVGLKKPLDRTPTPPHVPPLEEAETIIARAREQFPIPPKPQAEPEPEPADAMLMALWDGRGHTQDQRRAYYAAYEKAETEEEYKALGEDVHIDRLGAAEARIARIEPQTHAGWMAQAAIVATAYFDEVAVNPLAAFHMAERIVRTFDPKGVWQIEEEIERRREMEERNARKGREE